METRENYPGAGIKPGHGPPFEEKEMDISKKTQEIIDFITASSDEDLEDYNDLSDKFVQGEIEDALITLVRRLMGEGTSMEE